MRFKHFIKAIPTIAFILTVTSCSSRHKESDPNVLFPDITIRDFVETKTPLSEIIGDYRLVPLETTDESLIGGLSNKIIKKEGHIFVGSNNEVVMFDEKGNFQSKLSRVGGGPEEYESISDFDIVPEYGEIWVSGNKNIVRYRYPSMEYTSRIPLDFFATKFKYLDNGRFIAMSPDEKVYKIVSNDGKILQEYHDIDPANSVSSPVQFVRINDCIATQLGESNSAVCYIPESDTFQTKEILSPENDRLATTDVFRKYDELYGYFDSWEKVHQDYAAVGWFRKLGEQELLSVKHPGEDKMEQAIVVNNGSSIKQYKVWP